MTKAGQTYYRPTPLDFMILERLPDKGILGGVHWAGRPARYVLQEINEALPQGVDKVKVSTVQARLRSMAFPGYVESFQATAGGRIWARTAQGAAFLATREEVLGG